MAILTTDSATELIHVHTRARTHTHTHTHTQYIHMVEYTECLLARHGAELGTAERMAVPITM